MFSGEHYESWLAAREDELKRIEDRLGDGRIICDRCGCTLHEYGVKCRVPIDQSCPGYLAIQEARK